MMYPGIFQKQNVTARGFASLAGSTASAHLGKVALSEHLSDSFPYQIPRQSQGQPCCFYDI